jgi:hypothetical protein
MTKVRDSCGPRQRQKKLHRISQTKVNEACGDKALGLTFIYNILKKAKASESTNNQHQFSTKKH